MLVLGLDSKDRKSAKDKANIGNPKVNRGCPPLTANPTSADCDQNSLGPSIEYILLGFYHTGGFNAMYFLSFLKHPSTSINGSGNVCNEHPTASELVYKLCA